MSNPIPNILIVDDVADNLQVLSNILKQEGYQPRPVPNGAIAFKTMQVSLPDLILLDVKMPSMNGYEICQHLKADEKFRDIPVIFISALGETEDKIRAFEVGGVDYITKPFQAREIVARVKTHLALCQMRQALSRMNQELDQRVQERTRELETSNNQLRLEIAERHLAEEAVRSALDEKTVLLKEIHHRVKNNLQIIISLLNLQGGRVQNAEAMEILNVTRNRVYSMALLHETLYRSENFAHVDLAQYIKQVTTHLQRSFGLLAARINLQCIVSGVAIGLDQAVPCGLIINELVSNAFKYAFPEGRAGNVTIEMKTGGNSQVTMTVIDDGVGVPTELDIENTGTLGLKLVAILSAQLDGKLEVERNNGTLFRLTFLAKSK